MGLPQRRPLAVEDYLNDSGSARWELINGEAHGMAPAPTIQHQSVILRLALWFSRSFERGSGGSGAPPACQILVSPIDVVLDLDTVVQPDIAIVCDPARLSNGRYVEGAPDLVVEVLSPSTAKNDRFTKRLAYQGAGVPEYLIVDPLAGTVEHYLLDNGIYPAPSVYAPGDTFRLRLMPDVACEVSTWLAGQAI